MGLTMGEMFYLKELAEDCAADGIYEFFFCGRRWSSPAAPARRSTRRRSSSVLHAAVIGLGWWGRTIVRTLAGSDKLNVVAGVDPAPHAAEADIDAASLDAALADDRIEAVVLCTPHTQHASQILPRPPRRSTCSARSRSA